MPDLSDEQLSEQVEAVMDDLNLPPASRATIRGMSREQKVIWKPQLKIS